MTNHYTHVLTRSHTQPLTGKCNLTLCRMSPSLCCLATSTLRTAGEQWPQALLPWCSLSLLSVSSLYSLSALSSPGNPSLYCLSRLSLSTLSFISIQFNSIRGALFLSSLISLISLSLSLSLSHISLPCCNLSSPLSLFPS